MEMLESPSRGLVDDDESWSLRNPRIQEQFRQHIAGSFAIFCILKSSSTRSTRCRQGDEATKSIPGRRRGQKRNDQGEMEIRIVHHLARLSCVLSSC